MRQAFRRISVEMFNDPAVLRLGVREFRRRFMAAFRGSELNVLSVHMGPMRNEPYPDNWSEIRSRIFARDGYTCTYCGAHGVRLECDHRTPRSRGGSDEDDNLTTACASCNRRKWAKTVEEFIGGAKDGSATFLHR